MPMASSTVLRRAITAWAVIGAAGAAAWLATRPANDAAPAAPELSPPAASVPVPPAVGDVIAAAPPTAVVAPPAPTGKGSVKFPDGSVREALNGVTAELEIPWPAAHPWSPIVETVAQDGVDFYRHADGTFTTTVVRPETVSGEVTQIALCYTPSPQAKVPALRQ